MGTCYLPNGEVASGIGQAACMANQGNWVDDSASKQSVDDRGGVQKYWEDTSLGNKLLDASIAIPGLGMLGLGARGTFLALKNSKRIKDLIGFGKKGFYSSKPQTYANTAKNRELGRVGDKIPMTTRGPDVKPSGGARWNKDKKQWEVYKTWKDPYKGKMSGWKKVPGKRTSTPKLDKRGNPVYMRGPEQFSKGRTAMTAAGIGGPMAYMAGESGMIPNQAHSDRVNAINANIMSNMQASQGQLDTQAKTEADAKAEADRREGLGEWGRMQEDMKKPEFWSESMGGGPNDTRMMRMAQLMSWMGKTPNQKAQSTDPQKLWAEMEQGVMDNNAALETAQATLAGKSPYGKPNVNNIADGILPLVESRFGDKTPWIPGGKRKSDELESISKQIAFKFTELVNANPQADRDKLMELAFNSVALA